MIHAVFLPLMTEGGNFRITGLEMGHSYSIILVKIKTRVLCHILLMFHCIKAVATTEWVKINATLEAKFLLTPQK